MAPAPYRQDYLAARAKPEAALGPGAYNALRGRGAVTAKVIEGGLIAVGDAVICAPG